MNGGAIHSQTTVKKRQTLFLKRSVFMYNYEGYFTGIHASFCNRLEEGIMSAITVGPVGATGQRLIEWTCLIRLFVDLCNWFGKIKGLKKRWRHWESNKGPLA